MHSYTNTCTTYTKRTILNFALRAHAYTNTHVCTSLIQNPHTRTHSRTHTHTTHAHAFRLSTHHDSCQHRLVYAQCGYCTYRLYTYMHARNYLHTHT